MDHSFSEPGPGGSRKRPASSMSPSPPPSPPAVAARVTRGTALAPASVKSGNDSVSSTVTPHKLRRVTRSSPTSSIGGNSDNKASRGLRHFSMMVCKKVEEKGTTSYNEVADELVKKVMVERQANSEDNKPVSPTKVDEKNIRRRVYDALNVLMAMDIITKDKKQITWNGLPRGRMSQFRDIDALQRELEMRREQIKRKREGLRELLVQQMCFRNLVLHNHQRGASDEKIPLPFIVVNTNSQAVIQCDMSHDRTDVMFNFNKPFEINDDNTILKKMQMDKASMHTLREMLPEDLLNYCQHHGLLNSVLSGDVHDPAHVMQRGNMPHPPVAAHGRTDPYDMHTRMPR